MSTYASRARNGAIAIPAPAAPKGGGTIRGMGESFSADQFTGTASFVLPIPLPAARGVTPEMALTYHSGSANGIFGVGFDVGVRSIFRQTSKRIPRYEAEDVFVHSEWGELVAVPDTAGTQTAAGVTYATVRFRPRNEGAYPRIELWSAPGRSFWKVVDRDNMTSVFGFDDSARIANPSDGSQVYRWLVQEIHDAKGNHALYGYKAEDGRGDRRAVTSNRYPAFVRYANASPVASSMLLTMSPAEVAGAQWHFHVLFDYGEYREEEKRADQPFQSWTVRADPFSSFAAGFEIRTARLCRSILVFHHFVSDLGPDSVLVRSLRFSYDENAFASMLTRVEQVGFRIDPARPDAPRASKALPPMEFTYTAFSLEGGMYRTVTMETPPSLVLPEDDLEFVDIHGVGIPGVLHVGADGIRFWEPQIVDPTTAQVTYAGPQPLVSTPFAAHSAREQLTLADVAGSGRLQWLSTVPGREGIAPIQPDGSSEAFQVFRQFPNDYRNRDRALVNVTGTGLPDLVLMRSTSVDVYPCLGREGYGELTQAPSVGAPPFEPRLVGEVRRFADMFGSGQQHYVRIRNGSVTCWPNLGYGRFGDAVTFDNAPYFGNDFDPARLFLTDLDGSGGADIAYVDADCVRVYRNQSGNGFADPVEIPLPANFDDLTRIQFADVLGVGLSCLVITQVHPVLQHRYYVATGTRPHLLATICNNSGLTTEIEYGSSVHDYLAARRHGAPWITTPPHPVNVIKSVTRRDALSESTTTQLFTYRHGYYNSDELAFVGFGCVERRDAETFDASGSSAPCDESNVVPPTVERTWYHTGATPSDVSAETLYCAEYFAGDADAYPMPECSLALVDADGSYVREAHWSLAGRMLRQELYGEDGTPWAQVPYRVSAARYAAQQLQPKGNNPYSVFATQPLESIHYEYERNAADPRITHQFTLEADSFGNVCRSCAVSYPRRSGAAGPPAQFVLTASLREATYHNVVEPFHVLGVPAQDTEDEVHGLAPAAGSSYLGYDEIKRQLQGVNGVTASGGAVTASRLGWRRYTYQASDDAPLSPQVLLLSVEQAEYDRLALAQTFAGVVGMDELDRLMTSVEPDGGGYHGYESGGEAKYWWNPGETVTYAGPDHFYRPIARTDPFGWAVSSRYDAYDLVVAATRDAYGNETAATHIDYQALEYDGIRDPNGSMVELCCDPLGLVVLNTFHGSEGDRSAGFLPISNYQVPVADASFAEVVTNPAAWIQGAANFFFYDTLAWTGRVTPAAFASLGVDRDALWAALQAGGYITREGIVCNVARMLESDDALKLPAPLSDVRQAVYEILASAPQRRPLAAVNLRAARYPDPDVGPIEIEIMYFDGMQRVLQRKQKCVETQTAWSPSTGSSRVTSESWLTSGAVRYNSKGLPVRRFEPFFSTEAAFDPLEFALASGASSTFCYDPLRRLVYIETPRQTIRKTLFGDTVDAAGIPHGHLAEKLYGGLGSGFQPSPWTILQFDQNDTIKDSLYYQTALSDPAVDPYEKSALQAAALRFNTPVRLILDPMGRRIRAVEQNDGIVTPQRLQELGYGQSDAQALFSALESGGYLDVRGALMPSFQPDQPQFRLAVPAPFAQDAAKITTFLLAAQRAGSLQTTDTMLDLGGRPLRISDNRLAAAGAANFAIVYSLSGAIIRHDSADAGTWRELRNVSGDLILKRDARGIASHIAYDARGRIVVIRTRTPDGKIQERARILYGDSCHRVSPADAWQPYFPHAAQWNLRGRPVIQLDVSGLALSPFYSIRGGSYARGRRLRANCAVELDWGGVAGSDLVALAQSLASLAHPAMLANLELPASLQAPLEAGMLVERSDYDGLGRLMSRIDADGNVTRFRSNLRGLIDEVSYAPAAPGAIAMTIATIRHDAQGRPVQMTYPGTAIVTHRYDPLTRYLVQITTTGSGPSPAVLQDLAYYRDPAGNVTALVDRVPFAPPDVSLTAPAVTTYGYDSLYQLVLASGREQAADSLVPCTERYAYDDSGNVIRVDHAGATRWSRVHSVDPVSNRLLRTDGGAQSATVGYAYDQSGNLANTDAASAIEWSSMNQARVIRAGTQTEYNIYDADGQRLRNVTESVAGDTRRIEETTYAGLLEITRSGTGPVDGQWTPDAEWHAARISLPGLYPARWLQWMDGAPAGEPTTSLRYQLSDVIGSVTYEIDTQAQPITYQEYFPYAADAIAWSRSVDGLALKRFGYSAKEHDRASDLYYYGARHYSPSLMRWLSPDPGGLVDGLNLYRFVRGNPATYADSDGRMRIHHWNIENKTNPKLAEPAFIKELVSFLGEAMSDKQGTVVFLTEIMDSVTDATLITLLATINKQLGSGDGWQGNLRYAGIAQTGGRKEKVAILHYNVKNPRYFQIKHTVGGWKKDYDRTEKHIDNDRFIVGVDIDTDLSGEAQTISLGAFHNLGPGTGAKDRAIKARGAARKTGLHVVIGDWNVEPPNQGEEKEYKRTRTGEVTDSINYGNMSTSRGGSYYDYADIFNGRLGDSWLHVDNLTGGKYDHSDHNRGSAIISKSKKRSRED